MISPQVIQELLTVRQVLHYLPASPRTEKGWTHHEQQLFWDALAKFPQGPWTTIAEYIGTKSTRQAMTHGQKLRQKLNRWRKRLRRTPAAALAMSDIDGDADADGDLAATLALSSVMMTSSAMPPAMMRNTSPIMTSMSMAMSMAMPTLTSTSTADAMSSLSHPGFLADDTALLPQCKTRSPANTASYGYDTMTFSSTALSEADVSYTELLMASLPFASAGITSFTSSVPTVSTTVGTCSSSGFDRTTTAMASSSLTPSVPSPFVSMERLSDHHHHAPYRSQAQAPRRAAPPAVSTSFPDDVHYILPQSLVDDLADVLWDY